MKKIVKYLLLLSCLISLGARAFIYDIRVMRRWDPAYRHYCYFIGLGDFHDKRHNITPLQLKQIDGIISRCPYGKTKMIVEDISSRSNVGRQLCGRFFVNSRGGILGGLAKKYRNKGFLGLDNVEYRFCRVASLAPVINSLKSDLSTLTSTSHIRICCLKNEIINVLKEISTYNDGRVLNSWYQKCMAQTMRYMKLLKFDINSSKSVADYLAYNTNAKNRINFVKKMLTFDSPLIDSKILHTIVNSRAKQNHLVIAGGSHVRNVSRVLQRIGYQVLFRSRVKMIREYNRDKCLGCNILPGGFCCKPEPADLKILHRFF